VEIREIKNKDVWEGFLKEEKEKTFLQSWNWGEFQERMGNKIWRIGVFEKENPAAIALVSKVNARRGKFLLIQHGPIIIQNAKVKIQNDNSKFKILEILLNKLKNIAKEESCDFIRIAPLWERNDGNIKIFRELGFRNSSMHASAYEATWKLDINPEEEDLLKNMRKTTRYLIRQTLKNQDITIEKSERVEDIEEYSKLNAEVAERQKFVPFSSEFIKNEFKVFSKTEPYSSMDRGKKRAQSSSPDGQVLLFLGKCKGELAAAAMVLFWSDMAFYHQAASRSKYARFFVPYLLLWEAIKEAKKRGCLLFDFWGYIDPQKQSRHPWAGPTLFKMGFGGKASEYVKTQDLPLSKKYWLIYVFEKIRSIKRGL